MSIQATQRNSGFALVVALSLMAFVLLLLLTITSLVQVEQSAASMGKAQLEAEQNALLALNQALGTLQAELGPDQRISANADIFDDPKNDNAATVGTVAHSYLVGVWDTSGDKSAATIEERAQLKWQIGDPINYQTRAEAGFRRWLVSDEPDGSAGLDASALTFASNTTFGNNGSVNSFKAVGAGTLEPNNTSPIISSTLKDKEIWAPLKDVITGGNDTVSARIGWVVLDEGVKARMNQSLQLNSKTSPTDPETLTAWDNPGNIGIEAMGSNDEFKNFDRETLASNKISSFANASLYVGQADNGSVAAEAFGPYFHDVSLHSSGVVADVVNGGLRRDLSTMAEEQPAEYMDRFLYSNTTAGYSGNPDADPKWSSILDYIGLYKNASRLLSNGSGPPIAQMDLTDWDGDPANRADLDSPLSAPETYRLSPAVAQFETYFSLMALPTHRYQFTDELPAIASPYYNERDGVNTGLNNCRALNLCVTPVVTLYNPYNIPIEFGPLWIHFRDIPVGFRFSRLDYDTDNPVNLSEKFVPLASMNSWLTNGRDGTNNNHLEQRFTMKLSQPGGGRRGAPNTILAPGETIVFSPLYPDNEPLANLVNWNSVKQITLEGQPGYSEGIGLFWDALVPDKYRVNGESITLAGWTAPGRGGAAAIRTFTTSEPNLDENFIFINALDRLQIEVALTDGSLNPTRASNDGPAQEERSGKFLIELYSADPNIGYSSNSNETNNSDTTNLVGRYTFDYNNESLTDNDPVARAKIREEVLNSGVAIDQSTDPNSLGADDPEGRVVALYEIAHPDFHLPQIVREGTANYDNPFGGSRYTGGTVGQIDPTVFAAFKIGGKVTKQTTAEPFQPAAASAFTNTSVFSGYVEVGEEPAAFSNYNLYLTRPSDGIADDLWGPAITNNNGGYFFSGYNTEEGTPYGSQFEVPLTQLQSIASLQHANIAASGHLPQVSHAVGSSWAHPLINSDGALTTGTKYNLFDHSYLANTQLWDSYYFSTLADQKSVINSLGGISYDKVVTHFIEGKSDSGEAFTLPNPNFKFYLPTGADTSEATGDLLAGSTAATDAYRKAAAYQLQEGSFNINSTSVEAWKAILTTTNIANALIKQPFYYNPESLTASSPTGRGEANRFQFSPTKSNLTAVYSRFRVSGYKQALEEAISETTTAEHGIDYPTVADFAIWQGHRELNETVIDDLANEIVDQIRHRGPFLSLAEFVNRRLGTEGDPRTQMGAIDAAIAENTDINQKLSNEAGEEIENTLSNHITNSDSTSMIKNTTAIFGNTARGITSFLTQADILQHVGSRMSARSDTFVIRAYGEVVNPISGEISASSLCEAVVQRIPDYVDSSQDPYFDGTPSTIEPDDLSLTNERFGRKFKIVQLNWLNPRDV